jgi:hypothetical protein
VGDLTVHGCDEYGFPDLVRQELDRRRPVTAVSPLRS